MSASMFTILSRRKENHTMTPADKKANKITLAEIAAVSGIALALAIGLVALLYVSQADATEVHRGVGEAALVETWGGPVTVVRGQSNYPVYEIRESEEVVEPSSMRQWFDEYDAWQARRTYRRLHPRP